MRYHLDGTHGDDYPTCDMRRLSVSDNIIRIDSGARRPTESGFGILSRSQVQGCVANKAVAWGGFDILISVSWQVWRG